MGRGFVRGGVSGGVALLVASGSIWLGGCASSSQPVSGPSDWLLPPDPSAEGIARVLLLDSVDPWNAPVPTNDSERIVFSHVYVGLTAFSPDGAVVPMLAERVSPRSDALWEIRLRPDLRFSDGTSLRAVDVFKSWSLAAKRHPDREIWKHFDLSLVAVQGFRDLLVRTPEPGVDLPRLLTDPALEVVSSLLEDTLPEGAGPLMVVGGRVRIGETAVEPNRYFAGPAPVDPDTWTLPPADDTPRRMISSGDFPGEEPAHAVEGIPRRAITLRLYPEGDPRDAAAVLTSVDALLVRDKEAGRFLESAGFVSSPLPYDRGYLLLLAGPTPLDIDRQELADLTVMEDARPWTGIEVTEEQIAKPQVREVLILQAPDPPASVFGEIEPAALADAARIGTRLASVWSAEVVVRTDRDPHVLLQPGQAVVLPIARPMDAANLSALTTRWLNLEDDTQITILSLLESRAHLLASPDLRGVRVDGSGVPRFEYSGRSEIGSSSPVP